MSMLRHVGRFLIVAALLALTLAACTNDPFDPESVANELPVVSFFAEPVDPEGELSPTSYYDRTFHWSGTDVDGRVEEFYVSIRLDAETPAPWDTTTGTDTTMTFLTDDDGNAEATFYLACRDDRGAISDTLVRYVPLRNFPPALNYRSDFEPLRNMQREFVTDGEAVVDTIYWNWGAMSMNLFALDLDGRQTMDDSYRYTCADEEPTEVRDWDDPDADLMQHWLEAPFPPGGQVAEFDIFVSGLPAGNRTLTVAVRDEADAETRLAYSWEVRDPQSGVLLVPDNSASTTRSFYREFAAEYLGDGNWDEYDFWYGFPEDERVLIESLRRFDLVFWFDGGATSAILTEAAGRNGPLWEYVTPSDDADAGRLLLISRNLAGSRSGIPVPFRTTVLGVNPSGLPAAALNPTNLALGAQALSTNALLPPMTIADRFGRGIGLELLNGTEELYRFEECIRCFGGAEPWDPIVGMRRPHRDLSALARVVGISYQLESMNRDEAKAALAALFEHELGVPSP